MKRKMSLLTMLFLCIYMGRALAIIDGPSAVCTGASITLTASTPGGTWSTTSTKASVGLTTGIVTGISSGFATIVYSLGGETKSITVNATPVLTVSSGNLFMCNSGSAGINVTPTQAQGGVWGSSNTDIATAVFSSSAVGSVHMGTLAGTATISYTKNDCTTTKIATVVISAITGAPATMCANETVSLSYSGVGAEYTGNWSVNNTWLATINSSGVLTGKTGGGLRVFYNFSDGTNSCSMYKDILVNDTGTINDAPVVCVGDSITLTTSPGWWTSTNGSTAEFFSSAHKKLTGVAPGTVVLNYLKGGCTSHVTATVNAAVSAIGGPLSVCVGGITTLTNASIGGAWACAPTSVATINSSTGVVTGVTPGTAIVTYTGGGGTTACPLTSVTAIVSVSSAGAVTVSGGGTFCDHATITSDFGSCTGIGCGTIYFQGTTSGGTSTSTPSTSEVVTASGTYYFRARTSSGCWGTEGSASVIINPNPAPITGTTSTGVGGTTTLSDATPGGEWIPANASIADVDDDGIATGIACGSTLISYGFPATGCYVSTPITIVCPIIIGVCEVFPIEICDTTFAYCPGFMLSVTGAPEGCPYLLPSGLTSHIGSSSSVTVGGIVTTTYIFTSAPDSGAYTITSCTGSIVITIVTPHGTCYPCESLAPACTSTSMTTPQFKTITSAVLTSDEISTTTAGYYYIAHKNARLAVSPAPGSVLLMAEDVWLNIAAGDNINISGCHLFSGFDLACRWNGIKIDVGTPGTGAGAGQLTIDEGSLIECAKSFGVLVDPGTSAGGVLPASGNILTTHNAVFNFDSVGIRVRNYNTQSTLPFSITNSVFTARDFRCYNSAGTTSTSHYPYVWPDASTLKAHTGLKNDPSYAVDAYGADNVLSGRGKIGIEILNAGKSVPTTTPDPASGNSYTFYNVIIGDSTDNNKSNLFDSLYMGIKSANANVLLYNNVFRHTFSGQAYGVRFLNSLVDYPGNTRNTLKLLKGVGTSTNNKFYNCYNGVSCAHLYNFSSHNTWVSGTNEKSLSLTNLPAKLAFGFLDSMLDKHELIDDTIVNVENAIVKDMALGASQNCNLQGPITITGNQIFGLLSSTSSEYTNFGIKIYDARTCSTATNDVTISNNRVEGCVNSINIESRNLNMLIEKNTVVLRHNGLLGADKDRSGIICQNSQYIAGINKNEIYGDISNGVTSSTPAPAMSAPLGAGSVLSGVRGIHLTSVSNTSTARTSVTCNYVHDLAIGFKFEKQNNLTWRNNTMEQNSYGMVLQYWASTPGSIGVQGGPGDPSDNKWLGSWSSSNPQTYSIGSDPTLSTLYYRTTYTPTYNEYSAFLSSIPGAPYSSTASPASLINQGSGTPPETDCGTIGAARHGFTDGDGVAPQLENVVKAGQRYMAYPNPNDGNITIARESGDNAEVKVRVINAIGATVYSGTLQLNNGKANLYIPNAIPGMYLVELTDSKGSNTFRITVQK